MLSLTAMWVIYCSVCCEVEHENEYNADWLSFVVVVDGVVFLNIVVVVVFIVVPLKGQYLCYSSTYVVFLILTHSLTP